MPRATRTQLAPWEAKFDERLSLALAAAHALPTDLLGSTSVAVLVDALVNDFAAREVSPRYDLFRIDTREPPSGPGAAPPATARPLELVMTLPCEGAGSLLWTAAERPVHNSSGSGDKFEVSITAQLGDAAGTDQTTFTGWIADLRTDWFSKIAEATAAANVAVAEHRATVRTAVTPVVQQRRAARLLVTSAAAELDIPLDRTDSMSSIPLTPRALNLPTIEANASAGGNEAGLAADIADALIDLITSFGNALERMPVTANHLAGTDEEAIRDVLLFVLNANWKGAATGETFLGEGKTDILLRWRDRDAFIGECKIWHGSKAFTAGLDQLLGRYTVWRATRVALLLLIRDRADITTTIDRAIASIVEHPRFVGPAESTSADRRSFLMRAQHDNLKIVTLTLLPIVIPGRVDA